MQILWSSASLIRDMHGRCSGLYGAVRGRPVLTIGDFKGFRKMGGTLNLVVESDRMRFKVNLQAVRQQKLRIHPQLLKLASEIEE